MARRATDAGTPISHVSLGSYAAGKTRSMPGAPTRRALANALGVTLAEVTAAALESAAPELTELGGRERTQHAEAFLRLTAGRTDAEIDQLLGVVEAALSAIDVGREPIQPLSTNG
jgi:hypothetical protein